VKNGRRLGAGRFEVCGRDAEVFARDVAFEDAEARGVRAGLLDELRDVRACAFNESGLHEQKEARALRGEPLDEPPGDEAGEAR